MRDEHMQNDLQKSHYTVDLYKQYKKHIGNIRFFILKESQKLVVPQQVKTLLGFGKFSLVSPLLFFYKLSRKVNLGRFLKSIILPQDYKKQINDLDVKPS